MSPLILNILEIPMTSVISRGSTPVFSTLDGCRGCRNVQQPNGLNDRFDGVISGEALQATLTSGAATASLQLNSQLKPSSKRQWLR